MNTPRGFAIRTPSLSASDLSSDELTAEEQAALLHLAHDAIFSALEKREISLDAPTAHLAEPRGVFTSLYLGNQLRGCVGYVSPESTLYRSVADSARAAAFADTRFSPLNLEEAQHVCVELSVLSPLLEIAPEAVEVGRHGLLIAKDGRRGLLLPQVAVEHGWNRSTFLEQTCRKAGLPIDAWREGATIEAFTAQVFREKDANRTKALAENPES